MIPNQWYAVLESNEVKEGKPNPFKRLNQDLVFWRDGSNKIVVMQDRCPHRQAKLSPGKLVDGNIECPFHGFQFDNQGECRLIPANGVNGPRPKVFQPKVYPAREAYGFIWVWYGERQESYPPIPFFENLENFSYDTLRKHWNTHYTRAIENQLDVAHLPFVHATTIGREGKTLVAGPYTELKDNAIYVWIDNQHDTGLPIPRFSELERPKQDWMLCFKFPNIWQLRLGDKLSMMAAFVPIDDENTMMYVRFYHNFSKSPLVRKMIAKVGAIGNNRILRQDERVVVTQMPKEGGLDSGDKYIPADRPILMYYTHRNELLQAADQQQPEELAAYAERKAAG